MKKKKNQQVNEELMKDEKILDSIQTEIDLANSELNRVKKEIEETKQQLEMNARRDISKDEQRIIEKQVTNINKRKSMEEVIEKQKIIDNEKVTGRFMNRRSPGQSVKLTYMKYEDDPVKWYFFDDGRTYTIPRGFADQINEYYHTPTFKEKQGPQIITDKVGENSAIAEVDRSNKKYAFVPVAF
jgi:hypothetical protein